MRFGAPRHPFPGRLDAATAILLSASRPFLGMANLNVAVIAPNGYSKDIGKKGTVSDITLYDIKQGTDTVTMLEPTGYPDRLAPLFFSASMADRALVVVEAIDAKLGECMVMLHSVGVAKGWFVLRNFIAPEQLAPLIKGTVLENYEFIDDDATAIRQMLLSISETGARAAEDVPGAVPIDHFFNVKGVGTVILGMVTRGTIRKHDTLKALPTEKTAQVRSIQKHDDDYDEATAGDRVGLALKNITVEDLDRGIVLSTDPGLRGTTEITGTAELVGFWKHPLKEGMVLHVGHWMQFVPARITSVSGADVKRPSVTLSLEKPLVHPAGSRAVLMYLDGGKLRVAGWVPLA